MFRGIDAAPPLAAWTHREPDDPAIALIQGAAIVGDILTFYQEHYANEAYLRTAQWRERRGPRAPDRLPPRAGPRRPGDAGGRAARQDPVTIREGFPVKADLQDVPDPASSRPRPNSSPGRSSAASTSTGSGFGEPTLAAGTTTIELAAVGSASDATSLAAFDLEGRRQADADAERGHVQQPGTAYSAQQAPQLVTVAKVRRQLGRVLIDLESGPSAPGAPIGRFASGAASATSGHSAPPTVTTTVTDSKGKRHRRQVGRDEVPAPIWRSDSTAGFGDQYTSLAREEMPLDVEAPDPAAGRRVIVLGTAVFDAVTSAVPFCGHQDGRCGARAHGPVGQPSAQRRC